MNNSLFELECSAWTKTHVVHKVTGTKSRLLTEAEGLNAYWVNHCDATFTIFCGNQVVFSSYSYTDLLQYLRKEVA